MKALLLALSGSGFKFPAHVGALMAIRDAGFTPIEYAGTSGGSIVAALAASGMDLDTMKSLTMTRDWSDMLTFSVLSILGGKGFCSGDTLLDWITKTTNGATFDDLTVPLTIMASDASNEVGFEFSQKTTGATQIAFAARCSACIPLVYEAVPFGGTFLQDGGLVDNIPADKLVVDDVPRLGIHLVAKSKPLTGKGDSYIDLLERDVNMLLNANEDAHVGMGAENGARYAVVETGYANGLDRNMSAEIRTRLFTDGYNATAAALKMVA